ncbi:MAG: PAS domain S-box protein [Candidatus Acidiferrum sp.]
MYSREEIRGRTPDTIFPAKDIPHLLRQHESGHLYGRSRSEFYLPRKNGERIPAIFSARNIQGPDGQEYVLLIVTDISAQKRVEEQLRESNAQLEKRQMEIEAELSLAARVQQSLAPQSLFGTMSRWRPTTARRVLLAGILALCFRTATKL